MNDLAPTRAANLLPSAPSMLCVRPEIASALADREFVFDGSDKWNVDFARRMIVHTGLPDAAAEIERTLEAIEASLQPGPRKWLGDRLTLMWTMFMASRGNVDPNALAPMASSPISAPKPTTLPGTAPQMRPKAKRCFRPCWRSAVNIA